MSKKLTSIVFALVMVLSVMTVGITIGHAQDMGGDLSDTIHWELDGNGVLTISGSGDIPYMMTSDGHPWNMFSVNKIVIGEGITRIGAGCFSIYNQSLDEFGLTYSDLYNGVTISSLSLPSSLVEIDESAFRGCSFVCDVVFPSAVRFIGRSAFVCDRYYFERYRTPYSSQNSLLLNEGLLTIEEDAFRGCGFSYIYLPSSLSSIGDGVFRGCRYANVYCAENDYNKNYLLNEGYVLSDNNSYSPEWCIYFVAEDDEGSPISYQAFNSNFVNIGTGYQEGYYISSYAGYGNTNMVFSAISDDCLQIKCNIYDQDMFFANGAGFGINNSNSRDVVSNILSESGEHSFKIANAESWEAGNTSEYIHNLELFYASYKGFANSALLNKNWTKSNRENANCIVAVGVFPGFEKLVNDILVSGNRARTKVVLTTDTANLKVTVPTVLPVNVDSNNNVTVADNAQISNLSNGSVDVTNAEIQTDEWSVVGFNTDFTKVPVDTKQYGFKLNGDDVSDGVNTSVFNTINGNDHIGLSYDANVAIQSQSITNEDIGRIVFTVAWHK